MARVKAVSNPVLLSSTGRRVERVELRFPLKVIDLDDVRLNTSVPDANGVITPIQAGDALVWNAEESVFEPGSVSLLNAFGAGGFLSQVSDSAKLQIKDSGIYPRGVTLGGIDTDETSPTFGQNIVLSDFPAEGTLLFEATATQEAVFSPGYPYTLPEWERMDIINFGNNLNVEIRQDAGSGQVTAQIDAGDPVIAAYLNGGLSQELPDGQLSVGGPTSLTVSELDFIGDNWSLDPVPAITPGATTGEKINIRFIGGNITTSSPEVLEVLGGFKASVNFSGTQISVNTDLSLYDNSVTKFGEQVFVKDTGDKIVYWPDAIGASSDDGLLPDAVYSNPNDMRMGIGTDDPGARMEIALKKGTTSGIFDIKDYNDAQLKISNANMFEEANEYATFKVDDRGWLYIRNTSTRVWPDTNTLDLAPAEDYTTAGPQSLSTDQEADGQTLAHISLHAKNQIRLHADSGIFKFFNKEHWINGAAGQMTDPATARHPHFQIKTTLWTGETILWSNDGRAQTDEQQWFQDGADQTSWRSNLTLRAHGDIRLNAYSGDFYVTGMFEGHPRMSLKVHDHHKEHGISELGVWYKKTNATAANDSTDDIGMQIKVERLGQTTIRTTETTGESVYAANRGVTDAGNIIVGAKGAAMHFETKGNYYFDGSPSDNGYSVNFREYVSAETTVNYRRIAYMYIHPTSNSGLYFPPRQSSSANGALYQASGDTGIYLITNSGPLYIDSADALDIEGGTVQINSVDGLINITHNKIGDSGNALNFLQWSTGSSLTLSSGDNIYLTPAGSHDIYIPSNIGLIFDGSGNNIIESNGTNLTLTTIGDINLTATVDVNIPANVGLTFGNDGEKIEGDGTDLTIASSGQLLIDVGGDLTIDVDGADILLKDGGTSFGRFKRDTSDFIIKSEENNKDIIFRGQDGGVTIDALKLDMSDAGTAYFSHDIVIANDGFIGSGSDPDAIQIESDGDIVMSQDLAVSGSVTVTGDFTVNGTMTTLNTTNTTITDTLIELNQGYSSSGQDSGLIIQRGSAGNDALFIWDHSRTGFSFGTTTSGPTDNGNLNITLANIYTGGIIIADGAQIGSESDPDAIVIASGGDVTFSQSITVEGDINANGNIDGDGSTNITDINQLEVVEIYGYNGDTDTRILFGDDDINIKVGNVNMLDFTEGGTSEITFNEAGASVNVRMEGTSGTGELGTHLFYLGAGDNFVSFGQSGQTASALVSVNGLLYADDLVISNSGNIGSVGDTDAISIASNGVVTFSQIPDVPNNSFALGTDTTGNYIATIANASEGGINVSGSGSETAAVTLKIDIDNLGATYGGSQIQQTDTFALNVAATGNTKKVAFSDLEDSIFANVSGDIAIAAGGAVTIQANSVALGTDTTGNYVATITGSTGIDSSAATSGEGTTHTLTLDLNELNTDTSISSGDFVPFVDGSTSEKITVDNLLGKGLQILDAGTVTASDSLIFLDANDSNVAKQESIFDFFYELMPDLSSDTAGNNGGGIDFAGSAGPANSMLLCGTGSSGDIFRVAKEWRFSGSTLTFASVTPTDNGSIQHYNNASGNAGSLSLKAGSSTSTNGQGGDLNLYAGASNGTMNNGAIQMFVQAVATGSGGGNGTATQAVTISGKSVQLEQWGTGSGETRELRFEEGGGSASHYAGFKAGDSMSANTMYTLPTAFPGSNGLALLSTTAGVLSWGTAGAISSIGGGADNRLTYWSGTDTLQGNSNITISSDSGITMSGTLQAEQVTSTDDITMAATGKFYLDGGSDTYIEESSSNLVKHFAGNVQLLQIRKSSSTNYLVRLPTEHSDGIGTKLVLGTGSDFELQAVYDDAYIRNVTQDKDIIFQGNDGGTTITALTLDMSAGGSAAFRHDISVPALGRVYLDGPTGHTYIYQSSDDNIQFHINSQQCLNIDEDANEIFTSGFDICLSQDNGNTGKLIFDHDASKHTYIVESSNDILDMYVGGSNIIKITETTTNKVEVKDANLEIDAQAKFYLDGGSNTYMTESAADTIDWYTGGTHEMRLDSSGNLHVDADVVAYSSTTSDIRLKHDIKPLESSLSIINKLNPVTYKWKHREHDTEDHIGLIAQEVEKVVPSVIKEATMPFYTEEGDDTKYKSVRYTELIPHLIGAIKEQQSQIEELKQEINKLKNK